MGSGDSVFAGSVTKLGYPEGHLEIQTSSSHDQVLRCARIATAKAAAITEVIRKAVDAHEIDRQQSKVKRHPRAPAGADLVLSGADLHPASAIELETTQETVEVMEVDEGLAEGLVEEDTDEEDESDEEEEEIEKAPTPVVGKSKAGAGSVKKGAGSFAGGASTWLEEDDVSGARAGRKRDWRRERPAGKGGAAVLFLYEVFDF